MKVLVDEMYDWLDGDLEDTGYDTYSIKKLRSQAPRMEDDYVSGYDRAAW